MRSLAVALLLLAGSGAARDSAGPDPSAVRKRLERGYRLASEKHNAQAIAAFSSVLKLDAENHAALVALGYLYVEVKQWKSAAKSFRAASEQDPLDQRLRMDLGYALQASGDLAGAGEEFGRLAAQDGEFRAQARAAVERMRGESSTMKLQPGHGPDGP